MSIRIGINPITWSNDDVPELGGHIPLEQCLRETARAGYLGTELGGKFPRSAAMLRQVLDEHGLQLVSGWYDGRILDSDIDTEFEAILPHLTLLKACGARHVVYADTSRGRHDAIWRPISDRPVLAMRDWPAYGRKLTALADRMADFGIRMAFHHHMGTIVENDHEVDLMMAHTGPSVGLLFDSGHCLFSGGDPVALIRRHVRRVVHVHCKDARPDVLAAARSSNASFMDSVLAGIFTVPGDGQVDFPAILSCLAAHDYSGWLVVEAEQDPEKAHPLTYATMGYRNLLAMARLAGLSVETRDNRP